MKLLLPSAAFMALALILFSSCHSSGGNAGTVDPATLSDSALYNIDSVRAAIGRGDASAANKRFLAAIDIYKNVKDISKSIPIFKESIRLRVSDKAYFELGCALLDHDQYDEAIQALHIAEKLNYKPLPNVLVRLSAAYASIKRNRTTDGELYHDYKDDSAALHYMEVAIQMGYAHPEVFRTSDQFGNLRKTYGFTAAYNETLSASSGGTTPEAQLWASFRNEFQPIDQPLTINAAWIKDHKFENAISFDYEKFVPEMRNAKFSREVSEEYYYIAALVKDTAFTALLYAGRNNYLTDGDHNNPAFFFLATFDNKGKIIDKMRVAGQQNFTEPFKVFTFQPNRSFEVGEFKNIYRDNPDSVGYDSNSVVKTEPVRTTNFHITPAGRFEPLNRPLAMIDRPAARP